MGWTQVTSEAQEGTTSQTKVMEIKPPENTEVCTEESALSNKEEHLVFKLDVRSLSVNLCCLFYILPPPSSSFFSIYLLNKCNCMLISRLQNHQQWIMTILITHPFKQDMYVKLCNYVMKLKF